MKARNQSLHGPWPGHDADDEVARAQLREDFPGWRFWRAVDEQQQPGDWCAQHTESEQLLSALTEEELRRQLEDGPQRA